MVLQALSAIDVMSNGKLDGAIRDVKTDAQYYVTASRKCSTNQAKKLASAVSHRDQSEAACSLE